MLSAALAPFSLRAQDTPPLPPPDASAYVLHLDTRMAQIPTLILNYESNPVPLFDPLRVDVTIDNGHKFHPSRVRFEGDDPITLAILLDVSSKDQKFLSAFSSDFSAWVTSSLKPQDRVSIYAVDCGEIQTSNYVPPDPSHLQHALDSAISSPLSHGKKGRPACGSSIQLRAAMEYMMIQFGPLPGRHVLLVLSSGYDGGSPQSWMDLLGDALGTATTVFGIATSDPPASNDGISLSDFAQTTGGVVFKPSAQKIPIVLNGLISILRHRQILDVPLPLKESGRNHTVSVSIEHSNAVALISGFPDVPIEEALPSNPSTPPTTSPNPQP